MNRSGSWRLAAALACILLLPACSSKAPRSRQVRAAPAEPAEVVEERRTERRLVVDNVLARTRRLDAVAYPMWTRGSELCAPHTRFRIWAYFRSRSQFTPPWQRAFDEVLPLDERPTIVTITPGGPAEAAGLQAGDVVTAINDTPLPQGATGQEALFREIDRSQGQPVLLAYLRHGVPGDTVALPVRSCGYFIQYVENDELNSESDGRGVFIYSELMRFTENDDELAMALAYELVHNVEGHVTATRQNIHKGAVIDNIMAAGGINTHGAFTIKGALRYSQAFENEADYAGLYFMALGGYRLEQGPMFWRRFAAEHSDDVNSGYRATHPSSPQRFTAMERTIAEIKARQASGQPLAPELRGTANQRAAAAPAASE